MGAREGEKRASGSPKEGQADVDEEIGAAAGD